MTLSFFSLDTLQAFAAENNVNCMYRTNHLYDAEKVKRSVLEVAGFSEIIPCYEVDLCDDCYYLESCTWVLRIVPSGEIFRIFEKSHGKFRLYMYERICCRDRGFTFDMAEPNLIGKATEKKLSAWIDYLHAERTARLDYANGAMARNRAFAARVLAKFPDARTAVCGDGWTESMSFDWERFSVKYTANENGAFYRNFQINYLALPADEEMLA